MKLKNKKTILDKGCALSSRFCRLPPPPPFASGRARMGGLHIPPRQFRQCSGSGAYLVHAAALRDFCLGFFLLQNCAYLYAWRVDKKPFSLLGKNTLRLKFAAHSHVVTWETKRETTTKTKHSINTLRVVPSLHSKWAFTLVRLSYTESKNCEFYDSEKFWCRPKPPYWHARFLRDKICNKKT